MQRGRSVERYRAIDLSLLILILLVFETVVVKAATVWFPGQPYTVSLVPALTAIVMVRWGPWAAIHAALGGALVCVLQKATGSQYAIYIGGNLFSMALLPALARWRREEGMWRDGIHAVAFGAGVLLAMQLGRALISLAFGASISGAAGCFTTEIITDLFTLLILWIVRRLDGVLEDQRHYLLRIRQEENGGVR